MLGFVSPSSVKDTGFCSMYRSYILLPLIDKNKLDQKRGNTSLGFLYKLGMIPDVIVPAAKRVRRASWSVEL